MKGNAATENFGRRAIANGEEVKERAIEGVGWSLTGKGKGKRDGTGRLSKGEGYTRKASYECDEK